MFLLRHNNGQFRCRDDRKTTARDVHAADFRAFQFCCIFSNKYTRAVASTALFSLARRAPRQRGARTRFRPPCRTHARDTYAVN